MLTTPDDRRHRLSSVDEVLGDRDGRFFGEGFKRVGHRLTDLTVTPAEDGTAGVIEATAGLVLPELWSRKGQSIPVPHLSTIDVMLYAARLTGLYLGHVHRLPPASPLRIEGLRIKAGTTPDEDDLERFTVTGHHRSTEPAEDGSARTVVACQIGSMTAAVTAVHDHTAPQRGPAEYDDADDLPGPWNDRPFGHDHHRRSQLLRDVEVDGAARTAEADLDLDGDDRGGHGPTMIDQFVASLQLGQILLYKLDRMRREDSTTLWMRRTVITTTEPGAPVERRIRVALDNPTLLPTADGTWRAARIESRFAGIDLACNVAHLVPRPAGER